MLALLQNRRGFRLKTGLFKVIFASFNLHSVPNALLQGFVFMFGLVSPWLRNPGHVLFSRCKQFPRVMPGFKVPHLKFKTSL